MRGINNGQGQMGLIKISPIILVSILLFGCAQAGGKRALFVNTKCDDHEIGSDIEYSVKQLSAFLGENNIRIAKGNSGCGYTLKGDQIKDIEGALTDYDLMIEIKSFFGL